jgi:hypothetical protein
MKTKRAYYNAFAISIGPTLSPESKPDFKIEWFDMNGSKRKTPEEETKEETKEGKRKKTDVEKRESAVEDDIPALPPGIEPLSPRKEPFTPPPLEANIDLPSAKKKTVKTPSVKEVEKRESTVEDDIPPLPPGIELPITPRGTFIIDLRKSAVEDDIPPLPPGIEQPPTPTSAITPPSPLTIALPRPPSTSAAFAKLDKWWEEHKKKEEKQDNVVIDIIKPFDLKQLPTFSINALVEHDLQEGKKRLKKVQTPVEPKKYVNPLVSQMMSKMASIRNAFAPKSETEDEDWGDIV